MAFIENTEENQVFTVSEFVDAFNAKNAHEVVVEGEISRIDIRQGALVFICIKDAQSTLDVFGLTYRIKNLEALEEGMLVRVYGVPGLYKKSGRFRLDAKAILPTGEGSLRIAFERLKLKLEQEGLFDLERKRRLPRFPSSIALITAPKSQAYNDFVKVLRERFGGLTIDFYPVQVQGMGSEMQIVKALERVSSRDYDAVVLIRGGGSIEDLHAFNSEEVARAVFASKNPIICGVGHEGDVSLADLVADVRASTPSNAAELLVPERLSVSRDIDFILHAMESAFIRAVHARREMIHATSQKVLQSSRVIIDDIKALVNSSARIGSALNAEVATKKARISERQRQLRASLEHVLVLEKERTSNLSRIIQSFSHQKILQRGYSILKQKDGTIISSKKKLSIGQFVIAELRDGEAQTKITKL